jgi:hypothetical protein
MPYAEVREPNLLTIRTDARTIARLFALSDRSGRSVDVLVADALRGLFAQDHAVDDVPNDQGPIRKTSRGQ